MNKTVFLVIAVMTVFITSCNKNDTAHAILGKWELIGTAIYEGKYDENNFGTTWEFLSNGKLRICIGSRGGTNYGDPNRIGTYTIDAGNLEYCIEKGITEGPWACKFDKNQLELIRINQVNSGMQMIYISNYMYFKRIH